MSAKTAKYARIVLVLGLSDDDRLLADQAFRFYAGFFHQQANLEADQTERALLHERAFAAEEVLRRIAPETPLTRGEQSLFDRALRAYAGFFQGKLKPRMAREDRQTLLEQIAAVDAVLRRVRPELQHPPVVSPSGTRRVDKAL